MVDTGTKPSVQADGDQNELESSIKLEIKDEVATSLGTAFKKKTRRSKNPGPHVCTECNSIFTAPSLLKQHMRRHTGEKPFQCAECGSRFTQVNSLNKHTLIHTGKRPYKCQLCPAAFTQASNLTTHVRTHTGEKPFLCTICSASFSQAAGLYAHSFTHKVERAFTCKLCPSSYKRLSQLNVHMMKHTGEKPFSCSECTMAFCSKQELKSHSRVHTGERPYKCEICSATFSNASNLKSHSYTHTGQRPFKCSECVAAFTSSHRLKEHSRIHTGEKPFICSSCGVSFRFRNQLKAHVCYDPKKPSSPKRARSRVHGRQQDKDRIKAHISRTPKKVKHQCTECSLTYTTAASLRCHMYSHSGIKPFQCSHCSAAFTRKIRLRDHQRIHSGEKPYTCHVCSEPFRMLRQARKHIRLRHPGEEDKHSTDDALLSNHQSSVQPLPLPGEKDPKTSNQLISIEPKAMRSDEGESNTFQAQFQKSVLCITKLENQNSMDSMVQWLCSSVETNYPEEEAKVKVSHTNDKSLMIDCDDTWEGGNIGVEVIAAPNGEIGVHHHSVSEGSSCDSTTPNDVIHGLNAAMKWLQQQGDVDSTEHLNHLRQIMTLAKSKVKAGKK